MSLTDRIDGYADAILSVAKAEDALEAVGSELGRIGRAIESSTDLRDALADPKLPTERKLGIVEDLIGGKVSPVTLNLAAFIVTQGHGADLGAMVARLADRAAAERGAALAEVRAAFELDADTLARIATALEGRVGRKVETKLVVDPSVVGGFVATVGDIVIDATVKTRLDEVGQQLVRG